MLKIAHANNIVLMDLKPANIVRVCNVRDGSIHHKAIDFDHAIELHKYILGTSSSSSSAAVVGGTPRYIAPEVARAMLTGNNEQQQYYQANSSYRCVFLCSVGVRGVQPPSISVGAARS